MKEEIIMICDSAAVCRINSAHCYHKTTHKEHWSCMERRSTICRHFCGKEAIRCIPVDAEATLGNMKGIWEDI